MAIDQAVCRDTDTSCRVPFMLHHAAAVSAVGMLFVSASTTCQHSAYSTTPEECLAIEAALGGNSTGPPRNLVAIIVPAVLAGVR